VKVFFGQRKLVGVVYFVPVISGKQGCVQKERAEASFSHTCNGDQSSTINRTGPRIHTLAFEINHQPQRIAIEINHQL
jgi:hypothetical protein